VEAFERVSSFTTAFQATNLEVEMAHKQEEVAAANYTGLDRAEGTLSETTGHEVRFWSDENDNIWEEILGDPEDGRRRLAPDYCEFHVEQTIPEDESDEERISRLNAERQSILDEMVERCGRVPFHLIDPRVRTYHDLMRHLYKMVGKNLFKPLEEGETRDAIPPAYRVDFILVDDELSEEEMTLKIIEGTVDPLAFRLVTSIPKEERKGIWVRGQFIPDEEEDSPVFRMEEVRINADLVEDFLAEMKLDENLQRLDEAAEIAELVFQPRHDITVEERAVFNEIIRRSKENKVRKPREGAQEDWIWAYQWKSGGVGGWVYVGGPDSTFTYLGTERPEEVVEEFAEMFDIFNVNANLIGMLEDEGIDVQKTLGVDDKTLERGRKHWNESHSRSRKPGRRW
jgi:hypothetical protein